MLQANKTASMVAAKPWSGNLLGSGFHETSRGSFKRIFYGHGYRHLKRLIDINVGILIAFFVAPVICICALVIKLDSPGPVWFAQQRAGRGGKTFRMFKLRTMIADAEALKVTYLHLNTQRYPDFKIPDDPRITRVGRVLRKLSLDELPQIFNVIRGEMSLVGPRPTSFSSSTYNLWHTARLDAKPGITGLWQVSGRSNIDFDNRTRLDLAYIRNQSLWLDIKILFRTFGCIVNREGV